MFAVLYAVVAQGHADASDLLFFAGVILAAVATAVFIATKSWGMAALAAAVGCGLAAWLIL
jgi:hypothetical protein